MNRRVLYPSLVGLIFVPAMGAAGLLMGYFLLTYTSPHQLHPRPVQIFAGYLLIFCAALWVLAGVINFLPRACCLILDETGLRASWLFMAISIEWQNISSFQVVTPAANGVTGKLIPRVGADVNDIAQIQYNTRLYGGTIGYFGGHEAYIRMVQRQYGCDAVLISNYGKSATALADLLNEWRTCQEIPVSPFR